jgi:mRNA interferase RelE/StbE
VKKLDLTHDALGFLKTLPPKQFRQVATKTFELMAEPEPPDSKTLTGYDYRRADIGEDRIVYRFDRECLYVALIGKRNDSDIYKRLSRKL